MDDIPTYEELAADPEIAALLDFAPVQRTHAKANGWTADMQRMFIAWLAHYGSPTNACDELGKARSGIDKVYKSPEAHEFRASWDAAVALAEKRRIAAMTTRRRGAGALRAPAMSRLRALREPEPEEDEASLARRAAEAGESIAMKMLRIRRLYLHEISGSPGKRAAFEILTELPIDWEAAARIEPQPDEPYNRARQRQPDMILTAESGWTAGEFGYGPDKKAQARAAIDQYRAKKGLPPVNWDGESREEEQG